ncbi:MAG: acyltransferase [Vicingus serpentipes]|nr:acyltransferase [Vicingus serpentipes]
MRKLKGFFFKFYLQLHGCKVGSGLKCYSFPKMRNIPKGNIQLGNNVTFGFNCTLEVTPQGQLIIEDNVNITQNVLISSNAKIYIASATLIGENVSIRDSDHATRKGIKIQQQELVSEAISIGKDVWIGANTIVLKGSDIKDGCVIGANSLVLEKSILESNTIFAGNPVQKIKERD